MQLWRKSTLFSLIDKTTRTVDRLARPNNIINKAKRGPNGRSMSFLGGGSQRGGDGKSQLSYREFAKQPALMRRGTVNLVKNFMSAKIAKAHKDSNAGGSVGGDFSEMDRQSRNAANSGFGMMNSTPQAMGSAKAGKAGYEREHTNKSMAVPDRPAQIFRR